MIKIFLSKKKEPEIKETKKVFYVLYSFRITGSYVIIITESKLIYYISTLKEFPCKNSNEYKTNNYDWYTFISKIKIN